MMRAALIPALMALAAAPAAALDVGSSDYEFVSDLSARGFTPFGTGSAGNVMFGMTDGSDIYLCFLLDTPSDQAKRQSALLAELDGGSDSRAIPNIPVVCVLTQ